MFSFEDSLINEDDLIRQPDFYHNDKLQDPLSPNHILPDPNGPLYSQIESPLDSGRREPGSQTSVFNFCINFKDQCSGENERWVSHKENNLEDFFGQVEYHEDTFRVALTNMIEGLKASDKENFPAFHLNSDQEIIWSSFNLSPIPDMDDLGILFERNYLDCYSQQNENKADSLDDHVFSGESSPQLTLGDEEKPKTKRKQSKFKNIPCLAIEQVITLLEDWLDLKSWEKKKVQEEFTKSDWQWVEDLKELVPQFVELDAFDRKLWSLKEKAKNKSSNEDAEEVKSSQLSVRSNLDALKSKLLDQIKYKRFCSLVQSFELINDKKKRQIKLDGMSEFIENYRKLKSCRSLEAVKTYFKQNIESGLFVLRIAIELLSTRQIQDTTLLEKSTIALGYWLTKSSMKPKNKDLFRNQENRSEIRDKIEEAYIELEKLANGVIGERFKANNYFKRTEELIFRREERPTKLNKDPELVMNAIINKNGKRISYMPLRKKTNISQEFKDFLMVEDLFGPSKKARKVA